MWLTVECTGFLSFLFLFFNVTPHNTVVFYLFLVSIVCSYLMMWKFLCVNTALHPASHIFPVDINELCLSTASIWSFLAILGSCGNAYAHYLVDIMFPPFGGPNVTRVGVGGCYVVC